MLVFGEGTQSITVRSVCPIQDQGNGWQKSLLAASNRWFRWEDMLCFLANMWTCWVSPFLMLCCVWSPLPKAFNNKSRELRLPREVKACQKQSKRPDCNVPQLVLVPFLWTTMQQGPTKTDFTVKQISSSLPSILCLVQHPTLSKAEEMNPPA